MDENKKIIVAVICKNEGDYIEEFVRYHLGLGFDKIVIGDNNDADGEKYDKLLEKYIKDGQVEIENLRGFESYQKAWYNSIIAMRDYEWCAFIDADEFITFSDDSGIHNIREFLSKSNPEIKAYFMNWRVYGSNGHITNNGDGVLERFTVPKPKKFRFHYPFPENVHGKSLLHKSVQKMFSSSPHIVDSTKQEYYSPNGTRILPAWLPFNPEMDFSIMYVRHFYTKSLEEWIKKKMGKGYADIPTPREQTYSLQDFFIYNEYNEESEKYLEDNGIVY